VYLYIGLRKRTAIEATCGISSCPPQTYAGLLTARLPFSSIFSAYEGREDHSDEDMSPSFFGVWYSQRMLGLGRRLVAWLQECGFWTGDTFVESDSYAIAFQIFFLTMVEDERVTQWGYS